MRRRLRWVPRGHDIVDLKNPTMRQIARLGYTLGVRFYFNIKPNEPQLPGMEDY